MKFRSAAVLPQSLLSGFELDVSSPSRLEGFMEGHTESSAPHPLWVHLCQLPKLPAVAAPCNQLKCDEGICLLSEHWQAVGWVSTQEWGVVASLASAVAREGSACWYPRALLCPASRHRDPALEVDCATSPQLGRSFCRTGGTQPFTFYLPDPPWQPAGLYFASSIFAGTCGRLLQPESLLNKKKYMSW